ncbi:hypothetical protein [Streptomyces sp. NPDC003996]
MELHAGIRRLWNAGLRCCLAVAGGIFAGDGAIVSVDSAPGLGLLAGCGFVPTGWWHPAPCELHAFWSVLRARLAAVAQELDHSPAETHLTLRHLSLSPAQARELGETLSKLVDEAQENTEDQPAHGVLVALYQQALPTSTSTTSPA